MKKILLILTLLISLAGAGQHYIQASIQQGSKANSVNIVFLPNYAPLANEYVNYLSLSVAIDTAFANGVTADILMTGPFTGMKLVPAIPFSYTSGGYKIFSWLYSTGPSSMTWTANTEFIGATITFTGGTGSAKVSLIDLTNCSGGDNSNSFYYIITNVGPYDVANYSNLFYSIPAVNGSTQGTGPCGDQLIQTNLPISFFSFCPAPLTPTVSAIGTTSASINWNPVSSAGAYEYSLTTSSAPGTPTSTTSLSYSPTGLVEGTTYNFYVRSVCSPGNYSAWTFVSFATICPATASINTTDSITPSGLKIKWSPVSSAGLGYQYAITSGPGAPTSTIFSTLSDSAAVTGLTEGTTYYAQVRVICSPGVFSQWMLKQFTTTYPPCNPSSSITANVNKDKANITWIPPISGGIGFEYVVTTSASTPASGTFTSSPSASISGLNSNTQYYIYVRTQCGPGRFSDWIFKTITTDCYKPIIYFVRNFSTLGTADLAWYSVKGAIKYEYAILNNAAPPAGSINFTQDTLIHASGLIPGNHYYLHVRTRCSNTSLSDWSTHEFVASGLSINQTARSIFTITMFGAEIQSGDIGLFDTGGKLIKILKSFGTTVEIDLSAYAPGIYFIRYGKGNKNVRKIIKL